MFPKDAKILLVDDSSFARNQMKTMLRDLKFWRLVETGEAKAARDFFEAPAQLKDPFHLVILDIHMPDMSGLELLRWLRSKDSFKQLPVIMLTSSQEKSDILEAARLMVSHYMIKPFEPASLREKLESTWAKQGEKYLGSLKS